MLGRTRVLRTICFMFLILFADQIAGHFLKMLYFNPKTGSIASLNYSFKECKEEIVILGNSRAQHHYDTKILNDSLKMTCYNAGQDGGHSILLQYAQIKILTERYSPKIIILEFDPENIIFNSSAYDKLSILLPYYTEYPVLQNTILLRGPFENIKLFSAIYPFNSNLINIIRYNTKGTYAIKKDFNGYIPLTQVMTIDNYKPETDKPQFKVVDTNMVNALKSIIEICKEKEITLLIVNSPVYHTIHKAHSGITTVANVSLEIMKQENVKFLDFSTDTAFAGNIFLFKDNGHLNIVGATKFTSKIANWIKNRRKT